MNRKYFSISLVIGLLSAFCSVGYAQNGIAIVDMDTLFTKYYKTEVADKQLKSQAEEFNIQRKEMLEQLELLQQDISAIRDEAQNIALSEEVRGRKRDALDNKAIEARDQERKIQRFQETRQKQLQDQSLRMRKKIITEIRDEINTYAKGKNYSMVIDVSGQTLNGVEFVLYSTTNNDITADVLVSLNKGKHPDNSLLFKDDAVSSADTTSDDSSNKLPSLTTKGSGLKRDMKDQKDK